MNDHPSLTSVKRAVERLEPRDDGFERLVRYRHRRYRRSRLFAGTVALCLVAILAFSALRAFGRPGGIPSDAPNFGPIDAGDRHDKRTIVSIEIDGASFAVVRYDNGSDYCEDIDIEIPPLVKDGGGGCGDEPFRAPMVPLSAFLGSASTRPGQSLRIFNWIAGHVSAKVVRVVVTWSDGRTTSTGPHEYTFLIVREALAHPVRIEALSADDRVLGSQALDAANCSQAIGSMGFCGSNPPGYGP